MNRNSLITAAAEQFIENRAVAAGRLAETEVGEYLASKLKGPLAKAKVWHDIRIPRSDGYGKYEIDYLVCTPYGALVLEVKNYGGRIKVDDSSRQWIQTTSTMNTKIHECPITLTSKKIEALCAFLDRNGLKFNSEYIHFRLVLTNPRVLILTELKPDARICWIEQLKESLPELLPPQPGLLGIGKTKARFPRFRDILKQLNRLPTWDEIELHGGRVLRGDIQKDYHSKIPSRQDTAELLFLVPRHQFWGRFHPCLYFYKIRKFSLFRYRSKPFPSRDAIVKIQLAGGREILDVNLYNIKRLRYGWTDESYYNV